MSLWTHGWLPVALTDPPSLFLDGFGAPLLGVETIVCPAGDKAWFVPKILGLPRKTASGGELALSKHGAQVKQSQAGQS